MGHQLGLRSIGDQKGKRNKNSRSLEATLECSSLRSSVLSSQRKEASGTRLRLSATPYALAYLGRREKNKTGLSTPFSLISLVSLSRSSSLSLFSFPKFLTYGLFTIFYHRLSLPTLYQLGYQLFYRLIFPV